jgi:hypothetical protein
MESPRRGLALGAFGLAVLVSQPCWAGGSGPDPARVQMHHPAHAKMLLDPRRYGAIDIRVWQLLQRSGPASPRAADGRSAVSILAKMITGRPGRRVTAQAVVAT